MKLLKVLLIITIIALFILTAGFFLLKGVIVKVVETAVIQNIEKATKSDIDIGGISYLPTRGVLLKDVNILPKDRAPETAVSIDRLTLNVNIRKLIFSKKAQITLKIKELGKDGVKASGEIFIETAPFKNMLNPLDGFSFETIKISGFSLASPYINLKDISGGISFADGILSADNITFACRRRPHTLSLKITDIGTTPDVKAVITGDVLNARISTIKSEDIARIEEINVSFLDSKLELQGEVQNFDDPTILLHGTLSLNTEDLPGIKKGLKNTCEYLRLRGALYSEIYFNGRLNDPKNWGLGLKCRSPLLVIWDYHFKDLSFNLRMKDGIIRIPVIEAYPYLGVFSASFEMDISDDNMPYTMDIRMRDININGLAQDSDLKNKNILGFMNVDLSLKGDGSDSKSPTGKGHIGIRDANLGPMPILAPLLGNIYGAVRNMFPGLKSVEINGGSCPFTIRDRKVITDSLSLWGELLNIYAKGYIDFDKNLNFEVENEFKETPSGKEDWNRSIVEFMAGFGRMIGKAHLTGTLSKPKWKFDYFPNIKNSVSSKLGGILKDIFE